MVLGRAQESCSGHGRPTEAIVDLDRIGHNVTYLKSFLATGVALMAVVKADAYGHGALRVSKAALDAGAEWLGVALAEEAVELREAGIAAPILILGPSHHRQMDWAVRHGVDLTVFDDQHLLWAKMAAKRHRTRARIHLKLDTGMGRVGLISDRLSEAWIEALADPDLHWIGLSTHFSASDTDPGATKTQLARFLDAIEYLRGQGALPSEIHAANSAAIMQYPGAHFTMVRAGIAVYGLKPYSQAAGLAPALKWRSEVAYIKVVGQDFAVGYAGTFRTAEAMQLLSVPVGYADGYRRGWSNVSDVLIGGHRYPVAGRVSMDQITVAVPLGIAVRVGDPVVLLGRDGEEEISAEELAGHIDSISYEVVTGIGKRVPRRYRGD